MMTQDTSRRVSATDRAISLKSKRAKLAMDGFSCMAEISFVADGGRAYIIAHAGTMRIHLRLTEGYVGKVIMVGNTLFWERRKVVGGESVWVDMRMLNRFVGKGITNFQLGMLIGRACPRAKLLIRKGNSVFWTTWTISGLYIYKRSISLDYTI